MTETETKEVHLTALYEAVARVPAEMADENDLSDIDLEQFIVEYQPAEPWNVEWIENE